MHEVTFVLANGERKTVLGAPGRTVMRVALDNGIDGVVAECGGQGTCGTCHVIASEETAVHLPPPDDNEQTMLDFTAVPKEPTSRLSCQLKVDDSPRYSTFILPARQI